MFMVYDLSVAGSMCFLYLAVTRHAFEQCVNGL